MRVALRALALALAWTGSAVAEHGAFTQFTYENGANTRTYWVYVPPNLPAGPRPLLVYLHGCTQNGPDAAVGTLFNELADEKGYIAAYPEQSATANPGLCWNWFSPAHYQRGSGEPSTIAGITQRLLDPGSIHGLNVDPRRVFVAGASAGAAMAVVMGATYPDLYAAIGAAAGCAYQDCSDETGMAAYQAMGPYARVMPVIAGVGSADPLLSGSEGLVQQWLGTNDLADDGTNNLTIPRTPAATEVRSADPGDGNGYPYTIDHYVDRNACPLLDFYLIQGLSHAWPHGDPRGSATDPNGPDVRLAAYLFFMEHPMPAAGRSDSCQPPVAADDVATTDPGTPVVIDVLGNDTDADGDALTVVAMTSPSNGMVSTDGASITYAPPPGFSGTDVFAYTVSDGDGNGGTDTASVTVGVGAPPTTTTSTASPSTTTTTQPPGAPQLVLGNRFQVKAPGSAEQRRIVGRAKERNTDNTVVGDPRVSGASLRIVARGTTDSDQTFSLPAGGWTAVGPLGYRYSNRNRGGAVRSALIKRTPGGTFVIKVLLSGRDGPMAVVPPNPGDRGGFILALGGDAGCCVGFGGAAGGTESRDDGTQWSVSRPAREACELP